MHPPPLNVLAVSGILILIGSGFIVIILVFATVIVMGIRKALANARRRRHVLAHGPRVVGMVVFHAQRGSGGSRLNYPKIKYRTPDGREFRHTAEEGRSEPWPPLGAKVLIAYDPAQPEFAMVAGWPAA